MSKFLKKSGEGFGNTVEIADISSKDCKTSRAIFNAKNM